MGTPQFAADFLEKIVEDNYFNIKLVITQPDKPIGRKQRVSFPPVKELSIKYNLQIEQPNKLKNNYYLFNELKQFELDAIIVVAYGKILPVEILNIPRYGCINVHASLLPKYRGAAPIQRCLMNGENVTGITIMKMNEGLDEGDILMQGHVCINFDDDIFTLREKLFNVGWPLLIKTLKEIEKVKPVAQDHSQASWATPISIEDGLINWASSRMIIWNKYRALKEWPQVYTFFNGKKIKINKLKISDIENHDLEPGQLFISNKRLYAKTMDGFIEIIELQPEGKKIITAKDFINGYRIKEGDSFSC